MEIWGWLIGYVILFALLHLVLYYFYAQRSDDNGSPRRSVTDRNGAKAPSRYSSSPDSHPGRADDFENEPEATGLESETETVRCPHCGTRNEADRTFTYCWNCVSTLRR